MSSVCKVEENRIVHALMFCVTCSQPMILMNECDFGVKKKN